MVVMILGGIEGEGWLDDEDLGIPTVVLDKITTTLFKELTDECKGRLIK